MWMDIEIPPDARSLIYSTIVTVLKQEDDLVVRLQSTSTLKAGQFMLCTVYPPFYVPSIGTRNSKYPYLYVCIPLSMFIYVLIPLCIDTSMYRYLYVPYFYVDLCLPCIRISISRYSYILNRSRDISMPISMHPGFYVFSTYPCFCFSGRPCGVQHRYFLTLPRDHVPAANEAAHRCGVLRLQGEEQTTPNHIMTNYKCDSSISDWRLSMTLDASAKRDVLPDRAGGRKHRPTFSLARPAPAPAMAGV